MCEVGNAGMIGSTMVVVNGGEHPVGLHARTAFAVLVFGTNFRLNIDETLAPATFENEDDDEDDSERRRNHTCYGINFAIIAPTTASVAVKAALPPMLVTTTTAQFLFGAIQTLVNHWVLEPV